MSNYRRLISYIYAYEGGVKGKNVGYAKIEVRGGQCRISVSVKKIYVGGNDIGVYLLSEAKEVLLGNIFIRNGGGEFRATVAAANIEGQGLSMDSCYGLTIHDVESTWQAYTTIWEDAVAHAAELELAEVTSENQIKKDEEALERQNRAASSTKNKILQATEAISLAVAKEMVRELEPQETPRKKQTLLKVVDGGRDEDENVVPLAESEITTENLDLVSADGEPQIQEEPISLSDSIHTDDMPVMEASEELIEKPAEILTGAEQTQPEPEKVTARPRILDVATPVMPGPGDQKDLHELERQEMEGSNHNVIWDQFQRKHPKLLAFNYEKGCEILSITPQDLGLLPREIWVYGNNSFLLHGYYNYRHLILAKLFNPEGSPRYLLGVPGHYYSNERYMASMFGFPNFVLAKQQPQKDGRFGYWYTDIRI